MAETVVERQRDYRARHQQGCGGPAIEYVDQCPGLQRVGTAVRAPRDNKTKVDRTVVPCCGHRRVGNIKT